MKMTIDGREICPKPGQSLLTLCRELGFPQQKLSDRPLAAKIAGEVFTLNYVPVWLKDSQSDRPSIRRAMEASHAEPA